MVPTPDHEVAVDVWYVAPPALGEREIAACDALLSEEERASVGRFVAEANQRERRAARALVRSVLSRHRDVDPIAWQFRAGRWGKPEIDPPCGLRFNLAHHPTLVVCAVAEGREIGIDVEPLSRHEQIREVSSKVFAPGELAEMEALGVALRADRAVSLWTLKEAYIKARGMGLSLPVRDVAFHFDQPVLHLVAARSVDADPVRWAFATIDLDGHRIALALDAPGATLRVQLCPWRPPSSKEF